MDLISKTLHHIGKNYTDIKVIQIGAMDGISFDDTRGFLDMYNWEALLVEPIPEIFKELKENFKDRKNYTFEQSAITENDGEVDMLTVPFATIEKENLHPGYKGMSALYPLKNGFGSNYSRDIFVRDTLAVKIKVNSLSFNSLLSKHKIDDFDILICDAEGYDYKIFKQIDLKKYNLKFIRLEYINLSEDEQESIKEIFLKNNYIFEINGQDIDAVYNDVYNEIEFGSSKTLINVKKQFDELSRDDKNKFLKKMIDSEKFHLNKFDVNNNLTIVTGLWNIGREGRDFQHYIDNFKLFLDIPQNLFIYIESKYEYLVWEKRDKSNTFVKTYELSDVKNIYDPHWNKTQEIRTNQNWLNLAGWLSNSPQASLEWYNPIVQSKMFMLHDATIWNPFNSEYFFWLDAGITNTVPHTHLVENNVLNNLIEYGNPFLFLSYPYEANTEIHGFEIKSMNMYAGQDVKYVCRGGLFGGHKDQIKEANSTYYSLLQKTLNSGNMGTEESLFTIMAYNEPDLYKRYELDGNGLIVKFTQALIENNVKLVEVIKPKIANAVKVTDRDILNYKTNLYMLTFNFPKQILHTISSMEKTPEWLTRPSLVLLDNSTNNEAKIENKSIAEKYNFEYIDLGNNIGICGGRQAAAEHFDNSDADFMFFFEDDMTVNPPEMIGEVCRNGFRKYVPNLYNILHKIMLKDGFDFVKLTFTEVYFDNDKQCSWYNVPQVVRSKYWPNYDKLPVTGLDPNAPLTNFKNIRVMDGVSYIDGEIYYANWPMIVSKAGNKKMFIDTKWGHPYEQTWMSHMYQMTLEGNLKPAILLAAPIWHDRIMHYTPEERREN
jgi:FkbM family methyltransferase